jgi:hypothetical protein
VTLSEALQLRRREKHKSHTGEKRQANKTKCTRVKIKAILVEGQSVLHKDYKGILGEEKVGTTRERKK